MEPISLYGQTKVQAESLVLDSPNAITLRLATVFGLSPRMRLDLLVNHFVHEAVTRGLPGASSRRTSSATSSTSATSPTVSCTASRNARRMAGRPYNVGLDAANCPRKTWLVLIQKQVPSFYVHYAAVGSDPDKRNYIVSNQRLREAGFEARRSLEDGIRELVKGYRMLGRGRFMNV